jgi:DNA-binding NarL/FixJ family response regulator
MEILTTIGEASPIRVVGTFAAVDRRRTVKEATMRTDALSKLVLEAIQRIRRIEQDMAEALAKSTDGTFAQGSPAGANPRARRPLPLLETRLSARELEVLQLVAEGYANKQIAAELGISIKTVEKHRQNMMAKLDLHDTAGVTRYAISAGVITAVA